MTTAQQQTPYMVLYRLQPSIPHLDSNELAQLSRLQSALKTSKRGMIIVPDLGFTNDVSSYSMDCLSDEILFAGVKLCDYFHDQDLDASLAGGLIAESLGHNLEDKVGSIVFVDRQPIQAVLPAIAIVLPIAANNTPKNGHDRTLLVSPKSAIEHIAAAYGSNRYSARDHAGGVRLMSIGK